MKKAILLLIIALISVLCFSLPAGALMPVSNSYILDGDDHITVPTLFENEDVFVTFASPVREIFPSNSTKLVAES